LCSPKSVENKKNGRIDSAVCMSACVVEKTMERQRRRRRKRNKKIHRMQMMNKNKK
jgi:hypothetical protein